MERDIAQFIAAIKRIPLFQGLKPDQAVALLRVCSRRSVDKNEALCKFGEPSNDMYILLSGQLSVLTQDGVQVALINPVAPVGEMGIFTGENRSATVIVREPATLFVLSKPLLDALMRRNPNIEIAISRNVIRALSQRIRDTNREVAYLNKLIADQGAGIDAMAEEMKENPSPSS